MANFTLDQTGQEIQDILNTVGNNQATSGQVLTADGNGGASWQNASGGKLYRHNITARNDENGITISKIFITIINNSSTLFSGSTFRQYLYDNNFRQSSNALQITGYNKTDNKLYYGVHSASGTSGTPTFQYIQIDFANSSMVSGIDFLSLWGWTSTADNVTEL